MEHRALGRSSLHVAPLAFGGNVFGWTIDEPTSFALLDAFVAAGFDLVDTADVYSRWVPGNQGGESETIIGNWMRSRGNRDRVLVATKVGGGDGSKQLSKRHITAAVEDSLRRLQTDRIDLYQAHYDDADTPLEETLETFAGLIGAGKVRAIGASNHTPERFAQALAVSERDGLPRYESMQPPYNLYDREEYEGALQSLCIERQVGVIPYFSLAAGFLTGKYRSKADFTKSARGSHVAKYLNPRGRRILAALDGVAQRYQATPAQVALAWLIAQPGITAPIASATSLEQLRDLIAGVQLQLDADALRLLTGAGAETAAAARP
jgi:aryl-alcohol dehydrogenase-like predicted oxidoreductase